MNEENEENNLAELVLKVYNKDSGIDCFFCGKEISNNIKFLCQHCNIIFCIKCFLFKRHLLEHKYQIIDNLNFPLFTIDWKTNEEYKLLLSISKCGFNNWEDISSSMGNRGQIECESHYYSFYYNDKDNPIPKEESIIIDNNKNIINEKLEINKTIENHILKECEMNRGNIIEEEIENEEEHEKNKKKIRYLYLSNHRKDGDAESAGEILGFNQKRKDFEIEFLNESETQLVDLDFDEKDEEDILKLKYDILKDYNLRLKEREERKKFVIEKGLLDLKRQNRIESKLSKNDYELLLFLKPFARFYENSEFFDLFEGLAIEQELKSMLNNINKFEIEKKSKDGKTISLEDVEQFFNIRKKVKRTRKTDNLFTEVPESKKIFNLLGYRVERFLKFQKQNKNNKIFDDDEYKLIKEMPLARSTLYDIKKRANKMLKKFNDKESFSEKFMELLEKYDLEIQTKNDIP